MDILYTDSKVISVIMSETWSKIKFLNYNVIGSSSKYQNKNNIFWTTQDILLLGRISIWFLKETLVKNIVNNIGEIQV